MSRAVAVSTALMMLVRNSARWVLNLEWFLEVLLLDIDDEEGAAGCNHQFSPSTVVAPRHSADAGPSQCSAHRFRPRVAWRHTFDGIRPWNPNTTVLNVRTLTVLLS
ncbi:hypothetical protein RERY_29700 [Rhodococcus erythropolis]|nr:hypothetical protein RERY_29700 [Rhodococcus erythropolis]